MNNYYLPMEITTFLGSSDKIFLYSQDACSSVKPSLQSPFMVPLVCTPTCQSSSVCPDPQILKFENTPLSQGFFLSDFTNAYSRQTSLFNIIAYSWENENESNDVRPSFQRVGKQLSWASPFCRLLSLSSRLSYMTFTCSWWDRSDKVGREKLLELRKLRRALNSFSDPERQKLEVGSAKAPEFKEHQTEGRQRGMDWIFRFSLETFTVSKLLRTSC